MPGPLIVQSDKTVLLEVDHEDAAAARIALAPSRSSSARLSTCTPTASLLALSGTPAR